MWLYQYATGELQFTSIVSTYTLQVTAYQIAILLLYNEAFEWTLQQISEKTHIRTDILIEVLDILIEKNLLIRSEDIIRLNENFLRYMFKDIPPHSFHYFDILVKEI